jgi:PPM family protein phosphatase
MIELHQFTEAGGHAENEDALQIRSLADGQEGFLCVLADGQGGQSGAARAGQIGCQAVIEQALSLPTPLLLVPTSWIQILERADQAISNDPNAGFTTLVAFCLVSDFICGGSCGDSGATLISGNGEKIILTERQSKNPPVGSGSASFTRFTKKLRGAWTVLAMSDGVWKFASMQAVIKSTDEKHGDEIIQDLLNKCRLPGSGALQDDFTLAVFHGSSTAKG